jgi:hypothetical protein
MRRVPTQKKQNVYKHFGIELAQIYLLICDRNHAGRAHFTPIALLSPRKL